MLDPDITEERREQITAEARKRIESGGSLKQDTSWGMRKMAYEIEQRTEADYRLFRFETDGGLLDDLNHNLRIAEGVLRFRIFKVDPRSPAIVPPAPVGAAATTSDRGGRRPQARAGRRRGRRRRLKRRALLRLPSRRKRLKRRAPLRLLSRRKRKRRRLRPPPKKPSRLRPPPRKPSPFRPPPKSPSPPTPTPQVRRPRRPASPIPSAKTPSGQSR